MKKKHKTVLILASLGILGAAYVPPVRHNRPSLEFITKTYYRPTSQERQRVSEMRKIVLLREIRQIRKAISLQAQEYVMERDKIIDPTPKEQQIINLSNRLINNIFNTKRNRV